MCVSQWANHGPGGRVREPAEDWSPPYRLSSLLGKPLSGQEPLPTTPDGQGTPTCTARPASLAPTPVNYSGYMHD